jgi:predicted GIY-YIG superfamily endonuclease
MFVYLLVSSDGATYVGATVDVDRRLRQHNKELSGGARATGMKVEKGESWHRHCYIKNFPDWQACLQFEWRWKQLSRQLSKTIPPLERRMIALNELLSLDRPTSKAKLYSEWDQPPEIVYETL